MPQLGAALGFKSFETPIVEDLRSDAWPTLAKFVFERASHRGDEPIIRAETFLQPLDGACLPKLSLVRNLYVHTEVAPQVEQADHPPMAGQEMFPPVPRGVLRLAPVRQLPSAAAGVAAQTEMRRRAAFSRHDHHAPAGFRREEVAGGVAVGELAELDQFRSARVWSADFGATDLAGERCRAVGELANHVFRQFAFRRKGVGDGEAHDYYLA